jgi:hypothetical protein
MICFYKKLTSYLQPLRQKKEDLVAQLVEHLPFKEVVLGSSPSQVTKSETVRDQNLANLMISKIFILSSLYEMV